MSCSRFLIWWLPWIFSCSGAKLRRSRCRSWSAMTTSDIAPLLPGSTCRKGDVLFSSRKLPNHESSGRPSWQTHAFSSLRTSCAEWRQQRTKWALLRLPGDMRNPGQNSFAAT